MSSEISFKHYHLFCSNHVIVSLWFGGTQIPLKTGKQQNNTFAPKTATTVDCLRAALQGEVQDMRRLLCTPPGVSRQHSDTEGSCFRRIESVLQLQPQGLAAQTGLHASACLLALGSKPWVRGNTSFSSRCKSTGVTPLNQSLRRFSCICPLQETGPRPQVGHCHHSIFPIG